MPQRCNNLQLLRHDTYTYLSSFCLSIFCHNAFFIFQKNVKVVRERLSIENFKGYEFFVQEIKNVFLGLKIPSFRIHHFLFCKHFVAKLRSVTCRD